MGVFGGLVNEDLIRKAYVHLRKTNNTIPSETLDYMLRASLEQLKKDEADYQDREERKWQTN